MSYQITKVEVTARITCTCGYSFTVTAKTTPEEQEIIIDQCSNCKKQKFKYTTPLDRAVININPE